MGIELEDIVKKIDDLTIEMSTQSEERFSIGGQGDNIPCSPMVVFYTGRHAYEVKEETSNVLYHIWKDRAAYICHQLVEQGTLVEETGEAESVEHFKEKIKKMIQTENCFEDNSKLFACVVFDVRDYQDKESFQTFFEKLKEKFSAELFSDSSDLCWMSIVLLSESISNEQRKSDEIRAYLSGVFGGNDRIYDSNIILSNHLSDGTNLSEENENKGLIGNLLVITNNSGKNNLISHDVLFPSKDANYCLTASYTYRKRPNMEIMQLIVESVVSWLVNYMQNAPMLSTDMLERRLEIQNGKMKFMSDYLESSVQYPAPEVLEYLPRLENNREMIQEMDYQRCKQVTAGAIDTFYEEAFKANLDIEDFRKQLRTYLYQKINGNEAMKLDENIVKQILSHLNSSQMIQINQRKVYEYLRSQTEKEIEVKLHGTLKDELIKMRDCATENQLTLQRLKRHYQENINAITDDSLRLYYQEMTVQFLEENRKRVKGFITECFEGDDIGNGVWILISKILKEIIQVNDIFNQSLASELARRSGNDILEEQDILYQELLREASNKIRLNTRYPVTELQKIFVLDVNKTDFVSISRRNNVRPSFINSGDSNFISLTQIYLCEGTRL